MTEKRFTHKKWYNERQLFDGEKPFAIVDVYNQAEAICCKLNELNDENKELKKENKWLKQYKKAIWDCDSSKIIRVNKNTGEVDLVDKELEE